MASDPQKHSEPAPTRIEPTIGRVVWYFPNGREFTDTSSLRILDAKTPMKADVVFVWPESNAMGWRMVNLSIFDHSAHHHRGIRIPLVQEGDVPPALGSSPYCAWMPYQKGQAAKAEAAEAALKEAKAQ